ncbi:MAG: TonB-dependent receptor, partial [Oleibacter sp.]|nr:TonB-dependent receptor [Thalassolituus sp.]
IKLHAEELTVSSETISSEIVVTGQANEVIATGESVLSDEQLQRAQAASLGDTLSQQPGVQNANFGVAVGRPVIRGLGGSRVTIMQDGLSSADASSASPDHAVATDTDHADAIRLLRGPQALIYGNGALGGVVDVVTRPLAEGESDTELKTSLDTATRGRFFSLGHRQQGETWGFGVNASERRSEDYRIPASADEGAYQDNSDIEHQRQLGADITYLKADGSSTNFSVSYLDSKFGLPGHDHAEEHADEDPLAMEEHEEEGDARVDLERLRLGLKHIQLTPFAGAEYWQTDISWTDYQHSEGHEEVHSDEEIAEPEHDHAGMTTFGNEAWSLRSELALEEIAGVRQQIGIDTHFSDFSAQGGEALMPSTETVELGAFWLGEKQLGATTVTLAARADKVSHSPESPSALEDACTFAAADVNDKQFGHASASLGLDYMLTDQWTLSTSVGSISRAPSAAELYSCGPHESSLAYEVGDPDLDNERAFNVEVGADYMGEKLTASVSLYRQQIADFIYAAARINGDASGIEEADELPIYDYQQQDALLTGAEVQMGYQWTDQWRTSVMGDTLKGSLLGDGELPRMPSSRVGLGIDYSTFKWSGFAQI